MQKEEREEKTEYSCKQLQVHSENVLKKAKQTHAIKNELELNIMPDLWHSCREFALIAFY